MSTTTSTYALVKHARGDTPWDVEVNADLDTIDAELAKPRIIFSSPTVGATTTCDLNNGRVFVFTVSQATTLSFTNTPAATFAVRIRLLITNGSAFALTFPASVTWLSGVAPSLQASGIDAIDLVTKDAGVTWFAVQFGKQASYKGDTAGWALQNTAGTDMVRVTGAASSRTLQSRLGNATTVGTPISIPNSSTDLTTTASGAGSPANLKAYVIPADLLNQLGQGVRVRAWGITANNINIKTVRVKFGATVLITVALQASIIDHWWIDVEVYRTAATVGDVICTSQTKGTGVKNVEYTAAAGLSDWTSTGNTLQFDCTQTSAADVSQKGLKVEWLGF